MKLPNFENAIIPQAKIAEYLLSPTHRDGRTKAEFFTRFGFSRENWEEMASALRQHSAEHEVTKIDRSRFGIRYVIDGIMRMPDGRTPLVRTVWYIEDGEQNPRLVTAYPLRRRGV